MLGLELGADDYLCKPFSMRELMARVKVLFRRLALAAHPGDDAEQLLEVGRLTLDLRRYTAIWDGSPGAADGDRVHDPPRARQAARTRQDAGPAR